MGNYKEFRFQGLDAKTEIKLALCLIFPALAIMIGTLVLTNTLLPQIHFLYPLIFGALLTLSVCMIILKQLTKLVKNKEWSVILNNESLQIKFQNLDHNF